MSDSARDLLLELWQYGLEHADVHGIGPCPGDPCFCGLADIEARIEEFLGPAKRHPVTIAGIDVRPVLVDHLDGAPEVPMWRANDRHGRPHVKATPEAAAVAAGARITLDQPSQ